MKNLFNNQLKDLMYIFRRTKINSWIFYIKKFDETARYLKKIMIFHTGKCVKLNFNLK